MHDSLFGNQAALRENDIWNRAQTLGMDSAQLKRCLSSQKYLDQIRKSATEAQSVGIGHIFLASPTGCIGAELASMKVNLF